MTAQEFTITGRVQGVFFRATAKKKAEELGVNGWIANNADGSVTVHAEGNSSAVRDFESWCHIGPTGAQVDRVDSKEAFAENAELFEIVY